MLHGCWVRARPPPLAPRGTGHYLARPVGQPGSGMLSRAPPIWEINSPPPPHPRSLEGSEIRDFFVLDYVLATNASRVFPNAVRTSSVTSSLLLAGHHKGSCVCPPSHPLLLRASIRCDFAACPPLHPSSFLPLAAGLGKASARETAVFFPCAFCHANVSL